MNIDRLSAFLGRPIKFNNIEVHSPTIDEIEKIGEMQYRINLVLATFNKEKILVDLMGIPDETFEEIENEDDYEVLTDIPQVAFSIAESISFFTKKEVIFDSKYKQFLCFRNDDLEERKDYFSIINNNNYRDFASIIKFVCGINEEEKKQMVFKSERAKKMFKELKKMRQKSSQSKTDDLELKDILSIICNEEGNGISIFNVHKITVYQAYEHFERLGLKLNRSTILPVWANGHLKEGDKLPDIMVKTKF